MNALLFISLLLLQHQTSPTNQDNWYIKLLLIFGGEGLFDCDDVTFNFCQINNKIMKTTELAAPRSNVCVAQSHFDNETFSFLFLTANLH